MTMHYLSSSCILLLGFIVLIAQCNVVRQQNGIDNENIDCSKFKRDLDVLRSFPFVVQINPIITTEKTYAIMNSDSQIEELSIYHEINLPLDVFCLVNLHTLQVNSTPFVARSEINSRSISTGLSPLISRLNKLTILSLTNTTASYIPDHALAVLTSITKLEIANCGLFEIPSSISLLTNLEELRLPNNHLRSMPQDIALRQMSQLKYLDLSHNKIKDITDLAEIASRNVATMDLSFNEIDYIPPEISQFYFALMYLYLNDNQLTYIPTNIFNLIYLYEASFQGNRLPQGEILVIKDKFRYSVPSCTLTI